MKTLKNIAVLSLAILGMGSRLNTSAGNFPAIVKSLNVLSDTTEPSSKNAPVNSDTAQPYSANAALRDSSEDEDENDGDPTKPAGVTPNTNSLESLEDIPAGDLYGEDWDTTIVHAEKFDALTFDDTIRIPLNDPGHCQYRHPFNGGTTSGFGFRSYRYHFGVDINLETGDSVHCAFDGKVRIAQRSKTYGYVVVVRHNNGLETYYAHLSKLLVKPGQDVEAGTIIGLGGNTGHSFGSHLHFEVRFRGQPIDPNYLIDFKNQTLRTDTYCLTKSDFKYLTEQYKVRHYSRKKKKTWYTYYCPGGAHYSTPEARAVMAKVPSPTMPGSGPVNPSPANTAEKPAPMQAAPSSGTAPPQKKPATTAKAAAPPAKTAAGAKTTAPAAKTTVATKPGTAGKTTASTKPAAKTTTASTTSTTNKPATAGAPVYYTIKKGDTLYALALHYGTTVDKICKLNSGLKANSTLKLGQKIRVK